MVGKNGFLRVVEAVIGIIIVIGFLLVLLEKQQPEGDEFESEGKLILDEIAKNETFREEILDGNISQVLIDFVGKRINNPALNYSLRVCGLEDSCSFNYSYSGDSEFYVAERVISTNWESEDFSPKKLKLFIWRVR